MSHLGALELYRFTSFLKNLVGGGTGSYLNLHNSIFSEFRNTSRIQPSRTTSIKKILTISDVVAGDDADKLSQCVITNEQIFIESDLIFNSSISLENVYS